MFIVDESLEDNFCEMCEYQFCPKCMEEPHKSVTCEQNRINEAERKKFQKKAEGLDD